MRGFAVGGVRTPGCAIVCGNGVAGGSGGSGSVPAEFVHPLASTGWPISVSGQRSEPSGTPSPSASGGGWGGGVVSCQTSLNRAEPTPVVTTIVFEATEYAAPELYRSAGGPPLGLSCVHVGVPPSPFAFD